MQAPTHITGPDATLCRKGEEIPAAWFDELPDLQDHLDNLGGDTPSEPTPPDGATTRVKATATVKRARGQS